MGVELTFQGSTLSSRPNTKVLIFWETWCPFSQRTVPAMERIYQQYRGRGLEVIGITQLTRSATEEKVRDFISQKGVTYPILKSDGTAWNYFDCQGTPWIAVVQDELLVWEGYIDNPELFPEEFLRSLIDHS